MEGREKSAMGRIKVGGREGGGLGHSIRTISTIIPSVQSSTDEGFSNQFHFHAWWLSERQSGHYLLVPILVWDRAGVREEAWESQDHGFGYFAKSSKFDEVFWGCCESTQIPLAFIMVSRIWNCEVFRHCRWTFLWCFHSKPTVQSSSMGCLCHSQWLPTRSAVSCGFTFARSSSENIPGHSERIIIRLHQVSFL